MDNLHLNSEETENMRACFSKLSYVINRLDGIVDKTLTKELKDVMEIMNNSYKRVFELEESSEEENYEILDKISGKFNFKSVWSTGIQGKNLNDKFPENITTLSYYGMSEKVEMSNKEYVTYLDLWKAADKLIARGEDSDHIFIEDFNKNKEGDFELRTGS